MVRLLISKEQSAEQLMQIDRKSLDEIEASEALLHLFRWPPKSLSCGCLFKAEGVLKDPEALASFVTRPTGGGVMLHGFDLCFSIAVGPDHPLRLMPALAVYHLVHSWVKQALEKSYPALQGRFQLIEDSSDPRQNALSCCMSHPTIYDLALDGKKILGSAQRRKKALLHQCSLHVDQAEGQWLRNLFVEESEYATMIASTSTWLRAHADVQWQQLEAILTQHLIAELEKF